MNSNTKKPPIAPPAYRPQPVPRVLQTKLAHVKAAPVYRPQPKPVVTQTHVPRHAAPATIQAKSLPLRSISAPPRGPASSTVQCQKNDAERFAKQNKIDIIVSYNNVRQYVNDTSKQHHLRRGLLDAWNKNSKSNWTIPAPIDFVTTTTKFKHRNNKTYRNWTRDTSGVSITTVFGSGPVSLRHSRGAPKVGSNKKDWGNTTMGDKYVDYIRALRSNKLSDVEIARALLNQDGSKFKTTLENRGAAMMDTTVYVAEEWRKQGAGKLYRAMLRTMTKGNITLDDFKNDFKFIKSAMEGRKQIGRIYDVYNEDSKKTSLSKTEQMYYDELSDGDDSDFSSDDEMRDEKDIKGQRLYAKKHKKK